MQYMTTQRRQQARGLQIRLAPVTARRPAKNLLLLRNEHQFLLQRQCLTVVHSACLQLLEISWNFIYAPGKFNCKLKYDNMPMPEPNLVTSLNPKNCHLTIFCAVSLIMSYITESACVCIPCCNTSEQ